MEEVDSLDELILDLLTILSDKWIHARRYAEKCPVYGKHQDEIAEDMKKYGLNPYDMKNFLAIAGKFVLQSIDEISKEKHIDNSRPYMEALSDYKEEIKNRIKEKISKLPQGFDLYLKNIADTAKDNKAIFSKLHSS